ISMVYVRVHGGGPFAATSIDSGLDGYRFVVYVGLVFAGGLILSMDKVGRVLGEVTAGIVLWQIALWFTVYRSFHVEINFWRALDFIIMALIFVFVAWLAVYLPYSRL